MKTTNKKGFTLIELLAVIVILGIIMAIAIPSMTGYIANSRKDTMLSTAQEFVNSARTLLISENALPSYGEAVVVPVSTIEVDKGGVSPYTNKNFKEIDGTSYVLVYNKAPTAAEATSKDYSYAIALEDDKGNCLDLVDEKFLTSGVTRKKRAHVKGGSCKIKAVKGNLSTPTTFEIIGETDSALPIQPNKVTFYE